MIQKANKRLKLDRRERLEKIEAIHQSRLEHTKRVKAMRQDYSERANEDYLSHIEEMKNKESVEAKRAQEMAEKEKKRKLEKMTQENKTRVCSLNNRKLDDELTQQQLQSYNKKINQAWVRSLSKKEQITARCAEQFNETLQKRQEHIQTQEQKELERQAGLLETLNKRQIAYKKFERTLRRQRRDKKELNLEKKMTSIMH